MWYGDPDSGGLRHGDEGKKEATRHFRGMTGIPYVVSGDRWECLFDI